MTNADAHTNKYKINILAEFADKEVENKYFDTEIKSSVRYSRHIILAIGLIYLCLAVYDYFYYDSTWFFSSFASRFIIFVFSMFLFLLLDKVKSMYVVYFLITLFEITLILGYVFLLNQIDAQGFTEQAMAIILMIFLTFLLPNRWIVTLFTGIGIALIFLLSSYGHIDMMNSAKTAEVSIYLLLAIAAASIFSYTNNYNKRLKFAEVCHREHIAMTDALTGIYNRLKFDATLLEWFNKEYDDVPSFCILLFDIDYFKRFNDTYGHLAGDEALKRISAVIKSGIRSNDVFARWGGEEFVVLLPKTDIVVAKDLAERIRLLVEQTTLSPYTQVTISIGVTQYRKHDTTTSIMQRVDQLMYMAKAAGRNQVVDESHISEKTAERRLNPPEII